ncbi:hypothetical protein [Alsobacter sp. SYSU BS001988]|jgi:hypothetical protein
MVEISPLATAPHLDSKEEHADHTVLHPKPRLREKALVKAIAAPQIDADMIARAERAVEALAPSYAEWMKTTLSAVQGALEAFEASDQGPDAIKAMALAAQDLRGQSKQFGYTVAARMATGLCELLAGDELDVPLVVIRRHVEAIASVVRAGVKDQDNATALELVRHLALLCKEAKGRRDAMSAHANGVSDEL